MHGRVGEGEYGEVEPTKCALFFGRLTRSMAVIAGCCQVAVGVVQLIEAFNTKFCEENIKVYPMYADKVTCPSPWVAWVKTGISDSLDFTEDVNGDKFDDYGGAVSLPHVWRDVFSFQPELFIDRWTPLFMGIISVLLHLEHTRWDKIADNWIRFGLWFIFQALWGSFGYAGNLGIITGFICCVTGTLAIMAACLSPNESRTMDLMKCFGHPVSKQAAQNT